MRFSFFILFSFTSLACAFGQARNLPVLYYLKENLIEAPVEVPQGKRLVWERVQYNNKGEFLTQRISVGGWYTSNPNEFIIHEYPLGKLRVIASLDGKEVWAQNFWVKRSTNVLYKGEENDIIAEVDMPYTTDLTFETDNGHNTRMPALIIPHGHWHEIKLPPLNMYHHKM